MNRLVYIPAVLASLAVLWFAVMLLNSTRDGSAVDPGCYIVTDNAGREHRLVEVPQFNTQVGAIFTHEGDWLFPASVETDKACLEAS
jgi:hypothetical protein